MWRVLVLLLVVFAFAPVVVAGADDRDATPGTFAAVLAAAGPGDTVLLASGNYGTWTGGSKPVTLKAAPGATATLGVNFTTGDQGLVLDRLRVTGGQITQAARDITIRNSTFTGPLRLIGLTDSNVLLERNTHNDINAPAGGSPARVHLAYSQSAPSGVTIRDSLFEGGDSDGIQTGVGLTVTGNVFRDICADGPNHTDNVQMVGPSAGMVIRGNLVQSTSGCETQGITAFDRLERALIEDNVIDVRGRPWGIEIYSDRDSVVRHNTLRYYTGCAWNLTCGRISVGRKQQDPAGRGTEIYDNVALVSVGDGSTTARNDHNDQGARVAFVGPTNDYAGYRLAPGSLGRGAASDGLDLGARITGTPAPTPTPTSTPTPTATPTPTPTPTPTATPTATPSPTPAPYAPACAPTCDETIRALQDKIAAAIAALG